MDLEAQDVDRSNLWFLTGISPPQKYHVFATSRKAIKKNSNKNVLFPKKNKIKNTPIFPMFPSQEKKTYVSSTVWVWVKIGYLTHG
jgi:transposase